MFLTLDEFAKSGDDLESVSACSWSGVFSVGVQAPLIVRILRGQEGGLSGSGICTLFTKASDIRRTFEVVPVDTVLDVYALDVHEVSIRRVQEIWLVPQEGPRTSTLLRLEGEATLRDAALEPASRLEGRSLLLDLAGRRRRSPSGRMCASC